MTPFDDKGQVAVAQGDASTDPANAWSVRLTDGSSFVVPGSSPPTVEAESTVYEIQRSISAVPFRLRYLSIYSKTSGYVTLHNKTSAVVNGEAAKASFLWSVNAGTTLIPILPEHGIKFSLGCQVALVSSIGAGAAISVTLGAANALFYALGDPL